MQIRNTAGMPIRLQGVGREPLDLADEGKAITVPDCYLECSECEALLAKKWIEIVQPGKVAGLAPPLKMKNGSTIELTEPTEPKPDPKPEPAPKPEPKSDPKKKKREKKARPDTVKLEKPAEKKVEESPKDETEDK